MKKWKVTYRKGSEVLQRKILADSAHEAEKVLKGRGLDIFCCGMSVLSVEEWPDNNESYVARGI